MTTATKITLFRVVMIPVFLVCMYLSEIWSWMQIVSCVVGFWYMRRRYELLRLSACELRLDRTAAGRVLKIGAPMAIQQSIVSCGFLFLQRLVNYYGESMIASYTVASRMENILMIPIIGIQNTMATFAGQNMGAQRPDRVSKGLGQGVLVSLGKEELEDILRKDGEIRVHCHYCNTDYRFTREDVDKLFP